MRRSWRWLVAWLRRLAAAGVTPTTPLADARQTRVVNTIALVCGLVCLVSLPWDAATAPAWVVVEDLVIGAGFAAVPMMAGRGKPHVARWQLLATAYVAVVVNSLLLGKASGQHLLLLPLTVLPFVIFGTHELRRMLGYSLVAGATMLALEIWGFDAAKAYVGTVPVGAHYEAYSTLVVLIVLVFSIRNFVGAHILTEDALRAREERYRLITETARDAILTIDAAARVEFASPACTALFGATPDALIGQPIATLLVEPLDAPSGDGAARHARRADGALVPVEVSIGESQLAPGLRTLVVRDLTERIRSQRQIDAARAEAAASARLAALGVMSGGIAHEINNPLTALALAADRLRRNADGGNVTPEDVGYTADRIRRITGRIDKIVSGLRFFARDGAHDPMDQVPLRPLVEDTLELCTRRFVELGVELRCPPVPDDLGLECRGVQISQVLLNLLSNALDAAAGTPAAWVHLEVVATGDRLELAVSDSGPGISPALRERVFEPFFTTKPVGKGTGLGLSVSHGIVAEHGGRLELDVGAPHTRFVVSLPRRQAPGRPSSASDASGAGSGGADLAE